MNDREQMKADVERIATLIPFDPDTREAWQRLRARLEAQPDREKVAMAIETRMMQRIGVGSLWVDRLEDNKDAFREIADAAIAAIKDAP